MLIVGAFSLRSLAPWTLAVLVAAALSFSSPRQETQESLANGSKRAITVADAIEMTRLADHSYFNGDSSKGLVATFSPDGKHFVVVLRKANLKKGTNDFSLLLFDAADVFASAQPIQVLRMASSSNREAIHGIKWFADNDTFTFIGEDTGETAQIYAFHIRSRQLVTLTRHPTSVINYDISADGEEMVYSAAPPARVPGAPGVASGGEVVIAGQSLSGLLEGDCMTSSEMELFVQREGRPQVEVHLEGAILGRSLISVSPQGRFALIGIYPREYPAEWQNYQNPYIQRVVAAKRSDTDASALGLKEYVILDTESASVAPALRSPVVSFESPLWSVDGQSVFLRGMFLPLNAADPRELDDRKKNAYDIQWDVRAKTVRKVDAEHWPRPGVARETIDVSLDEDLATPPRLYATSLQSGRKVELLDLNPQFSGLSFGSAAEITWKAANGLEINGGLYLPPDYRPGRRYPLVIQTHGFDPHRFSMDGRDEWSSGFAARPLAAREVIVLQVGAPLDRKAEFSDFGATPEQSVKKAFMSAYEGAIDSLDAGGMIDRDRVGISGFSATVCFVAYALTHANYRFRAAVLTDGIDCGYFNYLSFPTEAWDADALNGGRDPFEPAGLKQWTSESPGFNLNRVDAALRLVAFGRPSILQLWEWYVGLRFEHKPVDFVEIADASHLMERPSDRRVAMQGMVDWFCYWLRDEREGGQEKSAQYARWDRLRESR